MIMTVLRFAAVMMIGVFLTAASAYGGQDRGSHERLPESFEVYRQGAILRMEKHRAFQTEDKKAELDWNAPKEWRPEGQPQKGLLLVHGLGDSPWTFHDIGAYLAAQGFLVRAVLLPGHGTRPEDLLNTKLSDWSRVVDEQTRALQSEVKEVYLGGFSLGGNLVLDYAYAHPDIAGLLLFSPAFKSDEALAWVTPWIKRVVPWLMKREGRVTQNAVRYMIVPTNAFALDYLSARKARSNLKRVPYDKPVLMVVSEHDDILDSSYLLETFLTRFTNPASRLIWYGSLPAEDRNASRVFVRTDSLPDLHISQFSHMGVVFAPDNPLYGIHGKLRICSNGEDKAATAACEQGAPVWYAGWGYKEPGKIYARLTFNPYFDWQMQKVNEVFKIPPGSVVSAAKQANHFDTLQGK